VHRVDGYVWLIAAAAQVPAVVPLVTLCTMARLVRQASPALLGAASRYRHTTGLRVATVVDAAAVPHPAAVAQPVPQTLFLTLAVAAVHMVAAVAVAMEVPRCKLAAMELVVPVVPVTQDLLNSAIRHFRRLQFRVAHPTSAPRRAARR
jgi:hypothetical protein